jgi:hypothetical protein
MLKLAVINGQIPYYGMTKPAEDTKITSIVYNKQLEDKGFWIGWDLN